MYTHLIHSDRNKLFDAFLSALCLVIACSLAISAQTGLSSAQLTVERIYGAPSLSGNLTEGVQWSPDSARISFMQQDPGDPSKSELWTMNPATGQKSVLLNATQLGRFLQPEKAAAIQSTGLGRVAAKDYFWSPHGNALLFKSAGRLVSVDLRTMTSKILVDSKSDVSDPKFSPDGKWVSYLQGEDIWLANIATGAAKQLTTGGNEDLLNGQLDWVYPEELDLETAYWWSPDSQKIAFLQFNERPVTKYPIVDLDGKIETTDYPQAGEANPIVRVGVEPITGGEPEWMDTGADTDIYLPRVDWVPDSESLLVERLDRAQKRLDLLLAGAATGKSRTILTEQDRYWVNVSDLPIRFFADGKRFLWTSERTGFWHIYIYDTAGKMLDQLTSGNWEVTAGGGFGPSVGNRFSLDEKHGYVYFISNKDNATERQLYRVSLSDKSVTRVTMAPGTHSVLISPDASAFVDTFSDATTPPRQLVTRADGSQIAALNENRVPELADYHLSPVEFLKVRADDGAELDASIVKPRDFDPAKKYPVIVYVYGGPDVQNVVNAWDGSPFLWREMMAERGYIIFSLDNRGAYGRGHEFETPLYHHFGKIELADQLAGVKYLKSLPYVDPSRIGIYGSSYGGYMTLAAMFNAAGVFKAGAAIAPVTDWRLYDTIYTERYMGRPQDDPEGYRDSSPVNQAGKLEGKLFVAHGTGDDNVHFANTADLLNALILHGTYPNDLLILPGRGHGMSDAPARIELYKQLTAFFLNNL
ncbi:MAG TPA: S9 family peptidase [Candidatus Acidoferrales bacterium]|nr:S9 family peptidase [Candidatus Acidoferrales bacterium]